MPPKTPKPRLTKFELEIMDVIWQRGELAIREMLDALPERRRPAYTTVQTIVGRLEEKEAVERTRKIGNAWLYRALVTRTSAHERVIEEVMRLFGGSSEQLMAHLVDSGDVTLEDLRRAEERLTRNRAKRRGAR
jgi:predicted transcriptional regulator